MHPFFRKLSWLAQRKRKEAELRCELEFHLSEEAEERKTNGLTENDARFAARRDLGSLALIREDTSTTWGWPLLEQFAQDLRHGLRALFRNPGFTIAAVVTLALGIGLTTAIFTVVYGMLLRPLALNDPDTLMMLQTIRSDGEIESALSPPNFMSLREGVDKQEIRALASVAGFMDTQLTLTGVGEARRIETTRIDAKFFEVLGVRPALGRTFDRAENEAGNTRVAVLSYPLWQQHFNGDAGVLGRTILLNGIAHSVIGVMPAGFEVPSQCALWVPLQYGGYFSADIIASRKGNEYVGVMARLRPGVSVEAARAELRAVARRLEERFPETNAGMSFAVVSRQEDLVGEFRTLLLLLLGAVGLVLVIASANVASLLLARTAKRREEIAVRAALGAGRGRIVRQLVTESLALGFAGNLLGLLVAFWVSRAIVSAYSDGLSDLGLVDAIRLDAPVLAFAAGVTILSSVLAGLFPALRAADGRLSGALQSGGRSGLAVQRGERFRSGLVVAQIALAVVLLVGSGLLVKSFVHLMSVDPGFRTARILSFRVDLPGGTYTSKRRIADFYQELLDRMERQPGVVSAGAISRLPIRMTGSFRSRFRPEGPRGAEAEPSIGVRIVSAGFFETMGVPLVKGRIMTPQDRAGTQPVVIINEAAAKWMFPGEDPIGRRLADFSYDPIEQAGPAFTVVGVVGDVRTRGLGVDVQPEAYFAHAQVPLGGMSVVFHTFGESSAAARAVRREVAALDGNLPITEFLTIEEVLTDSLGRQRLLTGLLGLFSAVALGLSAVGIFGLVSFAVAQRTREIGVRIALGATPRTVVGAIVRRASTLVLIGLAIGIAGALALTRVLEGELFGVTPTDPAAFAAVTIILGATALVASVIPAWRAATVDPLVALRAD
jgi:putative ABC transport system permease protein